LEHRQAQVRVTMSSAPKFQEKMLSLEIQSSALEKTLRRTT